MFFVYILYSTDFEKYYVGQTNDIMTRLERHNSGYEGFTKAYRPWEMMLFIEKPSRAEAMELEKKLKNLSKSRLENFIKKYKGV
jgi:putative endonuclease